MSAYIMKVIDTTNGKEITLPVTPNEMEKSGGAIEKGFDTIADGDKPRPKGREAKTFSFSGVILDGGFGIPQYSELTPFEFEELLDSWEQFSVGYNKMLRLIVSDTTINTPVYLKSHSIDYAGGGRNLGFVITFTEWRDFDVKVYDANKTSTEEKKRPTEPKPKTHVVKKGETLTKVARKYTGNNAKWRELYEANKKNLKSGNADLIYPGEKLTIPSGWLK